MSKSLSSIFVPALGGAALVLGVAYGLANRDYGRNQIDSLESRLQQIEAQEATARAKAEDGAETVAALEEQIAVLKEAASASGGGTQSQPAPKSKGLFGLGREAVPEEIAAWNVDVLPDGRGLPEGRGDVFTGEEVFAEKCAACHGDFAEGVDNWPTLAGGFDTLANKDPVKTVGSYWPYLSTVWDYVHRSMPFGYAQSLSADEVYAIVAYILYSNDLVDDEFELSHENFAEFEMYNKDGFVVDDRPEREYAKWRIEPCMADCKESVEITMRASVLNVTPEEETDTAPEGQEDAANSEGTAETQMAALSDATGDDYPAAEASVEVVALDPELVAEGEKIFKKCAACHAVGDGAKNKTGPHLNGLMGRSFGTVEDFKYSGVFESALEEGRVWDEAELSAFLAKPKAYMKGTKMSFAGLRKDEDIQAVITYLKSFEN